MRKNILICETNYMKYGLVLALLFVATLSMGQVNLEITEIFPGQSGADLTADWFEITNTGNVTWSVENDPALFYDDESMSAADADTIIGIETIAPGEHVIVLVTGDVFDIATFEIVWGTVINLQDVQIGFTAGAGLGGGGDLVTLWVGDPSSNEPMDTASYPNTELNDGQSYDVSLQAFSTVGNLNDAVATTSLGGDASNVPNIASPGNKGPLQADPLAPLITANLALSNALLNLSEAGPAYIGASIGDPTDPAVTSGITFDLADADTPLDELRVVARSSNQLVVADSNLILTGSGASRQLTILPTGIGYATIDIVVTDRDNKGDFYIIEYAASAMADIPSTTRFHNGASDGSSAIAIDTAFMWVGDDEDQVLRLYKRVSSGYALNAVDFAPFVGAEEIDIEGSFRTNDTLYWMGSHTEASRSVIFSVKEISNGANSELSFIDSYNNLRADIIEWDELNIHGQGAGFYGLASNLEIEGLAKHPSVAGAALLGFRGPLVAGDALVIPVMNFENLANGLADSAMFGTPALLDLERHAIRSIECNDNGCVVIGGPVGAVNDFRLFTWSGNANDDAELRAVDLMAHNNKGSFEGIVALPQGPFMGAAGDHTTIQLLVDMGTNDFYGDGSEAKDLPHGEWKKFRSEIITMGAVETPPVAYPGDIIITEIMKNPAIVNDSDGEWFELYNTTTITIDLNGWSIADNGSNNHVINNGGPLLVAPGSYLVMGVNDNTLRNGGVFVDYSYGSTSVFALANADDEVILRASDGITIDSIAYDDGVTWPDPIGASMAVNSLFADNNDGNNWCESSTVFGDGDYGTPGQTNDCPQPPAADLQITEAWVGMTSGDDLTEDWFEITNFGEVAWVSGVDADLYYDDESQDPAVADLIEGITEIAPGKSVIVVLGVEADATQFFNVWSPDYDLSNVQIGWADGSGLGQGGDAVTLFLGTPSPETIIDYESFGAVPSGVSYDVVIEAFSQPGVGSAQTGTNIAIATTATNGFESAVASPGNEGPLSAPEYNLEITEIFPGQAGADLTADWFEITNTGTAPWVLTDNTVLFYDDESADANEADTIHGISEIAPGKTAVIVIGDETDALTFITAWIDVIDFTDVEIGHTDGAGLGGGGDAVTIWVGNPQTNPVASASYPNTELNDGQSYDVELAAFSVVGNANGAVATLLLGGDNQDVPNIGSPGNGLAIPQIDGLVITEIYSGQSGPDVTADWFEIHNDGDVAIDLLNTVTLYYDDESASPADATVVEGLGVLEADAYAIVVIGDEADASAFFGVWGEIMDFTFTSIAYADGAGLGGGGDEVTLWAGDPNVYIPLARGAYPDTELNDGQSYDLSLGEFSVVNNVNDARASLVLGGDNADVPSIASPGNKAKVITANGMVRGSNDVLLQIHPNPVNGSTVICTISQSGHSGEAQLRLVNQLGSVVMNQSFELQQNEATIKFSTDHLLKGTYLVQISTGTTILSEKLIIH